MRYLQCSSFQNELHNLQFYKRHVYRLGLVCAVLILLLSWVVRSPDDRFLEIMYPFFAMALMGILPFFWISSLPLRKLEILLLLVFSAMIMSRLAWHFHFAGSIDEHLLVLVGGHYWAVGILIVAGFVMLGQRPGLMSGSAIISLSILIAATGVATEFLQGRASGESLGYLLRVHFFLALLLGLTSAATAMQDKLHSVLTRSEMLDHFAHTDILTDLLNRRAAEMLLAQQASTKLRQGGSFSVVSADVDHFKQVNDSYGHAAGDEVLREIARRLTNTTRDSDFVARWGGEEFLVILPGSSREQAENLAERCREAISDSPLAGLNITMSFGVAEFTSRDSITSLLDRVDSMLYQAKNSGRNRVATDAVHELKETVELT